MCSLQHNQSCSIFPSILQMRIISYGKDKVFCPCEILLIIKYLMMICTDLAVCCLMVINFRVHWKPTVHFVIIIYYFLITKNAFVSMLFVSKLVFESRIIWC